MDTLVQNAAQFTVPLYNADGAAACLPGSIRSRQPRRTAADHNKIGLEVFCLRNLVDLVVLQELDGVAARLLHAVCDGAHDRDARNGGAGHSVDAERLCFNDAVGEVLHGGLTDADRFLVFADDDRLDAILSECDRYGNRTILPGERGRVGSGGIAEGGRC